MKTKIISIPKSAPTNLLALLVCAAALLAGCVVESVYPYYTEKDLTFDPALVGQWRNSEKTNEFWRFEKSGAKSYAFTTLDANETNDYDAHLFRLQKQLFLDACTTNRTDNQLPLHHVLKVAQLEPSLKTAVLNYDWLAKLLEKNPRAIRHIVVLEHPADTNSSKMIYLTADTKELQKFILKYAADTNAFTALDEMQRK